MKTPAHKTDTTTDETSPELELKSRIDDLRGRDRQLTAEIIELEKSGSGGPDVASVDIDEEAYATLSGRSLVKTQRSGPVRSLVTVHHERKVCRRAIEIGGHLLQRAQSDRQISALVARMDEWRALVRQTSIAVLELQKLNRARRDFKKSIGGTPALPCDVVPRALLGFGDIVGADPYPFIQSVLRQGIMTKGEVDRYAE